MRYLRQYQQLKHLTTGTILTRLGCTTMVSHLEVQPPMIFTTRIELLAAPCALAPTTHVLFDCKNMLTCSAKHSCLMSLVAGPGTRLVSLDFIVAADAGVEFIAAEMLDGNYVESTLR